MNAEALDDLGAAIDNADAQDAVTSAQWFAHLARILQEAGGWSETLQAIVESAGKVVHADLAALIGLAHTGGEPYLLAATDYTSATELVALQRAAGSAPAWQAILDRSTVHVDDLAADPKWPQFGPQVVTALSFRTVLAFCLLIDDQPLAALALYTRAPHGFTEEQIELVAAFAEHATFAFNQAAQAEQITNLQTAVEHGRIIGAALGIVMERRKITQQEAFAYLRKASQNTNRKLFDLAVQITETGALPPAEIGPKV